ncbi:hypothetical protein E3N88_45589 [Mikania micrantha]|uniref:DUF4371 domain-containing protein n=1 Tax=Mikania micrantha TaxID=192012 RepID=A0A5N6L8T5_9ASTR|nr:hypothetical protein E3N88_45589 [Mikania micrantha]
MKEGFNSWNKTDRFVSHIGDIGSAHNKALKKCEDLLNQNRSIVTALHKQDDIIRKANQIRLNATIDDCRLCLKNALSFRGHDESITSLCKGNFLEIMDLILRHNRELRELPKAAGNNQYVSPSIQKDVANCFEEEILNSIFKEIGDDVFALLIDESSDVSKKEQMTIVLRYVDAHGLVKERFVGFVHVMEASSSALKFAIDTFFSKYGLSFRKLRGQGYDGANNMRGEFNGLKARILEENSSAYYRKDQDILEAILLVETTKGKLQKFRESGFGPLLEKIYLFCGKYDIQILDMKENYFNERAKRKRYDITNLHKFDCFNTVVDMEIQEFGNRFNVINTELLQNMTAFLPYDLFSNFDASKIMRLCEFYPFDFDNREKIALPHQLGLYIDSVGNDGRFSNLNVATATVERCFSAVKIVKTNLRNRIGEDFLNACVISTVEKEALESVTNEAVIDRFQKMKSRRGQL